MELVEKTQAMSLAEQFRPFELQAQEWLAKAKGIKVTDASQTDLMKGAREARLALRQIRISVNAKHKELKEDALRYGQALDKIKRTLNGMIEPIETVLQEQEDFVKTQEAKAKKELFSKRATLLTDQNFMTMEEAMKFPLAEMGDEAFENMLAGFKIAKEQKDKKKKEDEEELDKLKKQKEERTVIRKTRMLAVGFKDGATMIQEFASGNWGVVRQKMIDMGDAEFEKEIQDAIARNEAEEKRKETNTKRRAARAPDKEKLEGMKRTLYATAGAFPKMSSEEGEAIVEDVRKMFAKIITHISTKAEYL